MKKLIRRKYIPIFDNFSLKLNFKGLANRLTRELVNTFEPADGCILYYIDRNKPCLVIASSCGYSRTKENPVLALNEGLPGHCLESRRSVLLTSAKAIERECLDTLTDKNMKYYNSLHKGLPPVRSIMGAPLMLADHAVGVVVLEQFNTEHRKFNRTDKNYLEIVSHWIALMLEHIRLNSELKDTKRSYRELFGKVLMSNEDERKRISREIHDEINHILLSVKISLEDIQNSLSPEFAAIKDKLKILNSHIGKAFDELHRLSFDLRPPGLDELGLPEALRWYLDTISTESGLPINFEVQGTEFRKPAPIVEMALFRIAQEAVANVIKHAKASSALVKLHYNGENINLEISDDGVGFDVTSVFSMQTTPRNLGLLGLKERAEMCGGKLTIDSSPGNGTRVKTVIPIKSYDWGTY
ncbi:MAG: GAF domain-containing sensor histidine kinase [Dehalococcoidales bacterium]|jgi:signal transduction histidine kinase|nr:GAF domain-containing sensor histidine kinase [Dehalococcoidales bacterium]